ncbi:MAG: glutamate 5-kinase [Gemmatimonadetes bacterium]|jgi:glutamate 5-kinase|nr:glutamate 5-kinase [Gemmatimonadota bacterium]HAC05358.1 glutamate 5-kinase [Gemmatimonadota bacterium]HBD97353.1 glutamate 5-kinase [Gemmatimonadota bacterium]HIN50523.1 glutamate 5-kinase [Gemmatimonadota bacterium]|tara:strand:- start:2687 stop:3871 length:1185 start_codon:yes stop_codon:yes gene_type:complete
MHDIAIRRTRSKAGKLPRDQRDATPRLKPKRVVLKLGSRTLTAGGAELCAETLARVAASVTRATDVEVVIVSSGAVAAGFRVLGFDAPPEAVRDRQAAAAVGQTRLMSMWEAVFRDRGRDVAQVLLTNDCLADRRRYVTVRDAFTALLDRGVIPIVNENDTVSVDEIMVGDNDNLAAITAALVDADLLVLLTDVAGVFARDPRKDPDVLPIPFARSATELKELCFKKASRESIGGMVTKLEAAERAGRYGIPTVIASGTDADTISAVLRGDQIGTYIAPAAEPLRARQHWMAVQRRLEGSLVVDDGAVSAIRGRASLLPRGIVEVLGRFRKGDLVSVVDRAGVERARGIVRFDDRDVERIRGLHSSDLEQVLGREVGAVVMRSDRMFIMDEEQG